MARNDRRRRVLERLGEDERLRGDLEDTAASALLAWAERRARAAADDTSQSDQQVEAMVQAVRAAVQAAATSGETEPRRLVALAESQLSTAAVTGDPPVSSGAPAQPAPPVEATSAPAATPGRSHRRHRLARYFKHRRGRLVR
jgi:hypothetical protein